MDMIRTKNEPARDADGFRMKAPKGSALPEITVTIHGELGAKNWSQPDGRGCVTQYLTLDERREAARRANAYSQLVATLRTLIEAERDRSLGGGLLERFRLASVLLSKLGEE